MDTVDKDFGLWAIKLPDGEFVGHGYPTLFAYKHRANRHARFIKGCRVVAVEVKETN